MTTIQDQSDETLRRLMQGADEWLTYCPEGGEISAREDVERLVADRGWLVADYSQSDDGPVFTLWRC